MIVRANAAHGDPRIRAMPSRGKCSPLGASCVVFRSIQRASILVRGPQRLQDRAHEASSPDRRHDAPIRDYVGASQSHAAPDLKAHILCAALGA